jgi:hypothetical protein
MKSRLVSRLLFTFLACRPDKNVCPSGQSKSKLQKEFADIRKTFNSRYVRLYGACDKDGFYDDIVDAAWDNGLGVHALIWVGIRTPPDYLTNSTLVRRSLGLTAVTSGKSVETASLLLSIRILKLNLSHALFNLAPNLYSTTSCHMRSWPPKYRRLRPIYQV